MGWFAALQSRPERMAGIDDFTTLPLRPGCRASGRIQSADSKRSLFLQTARLEMDISRNNGKERNLELVEEDAPRVRPICSLVYRPLYCGRVGLSQSVFLDFWHNLRCRRCRSPVLAASRIELVLANCDFDRGGQSRTSLG